MEIAEQLRIISEAIEAVEATGKENLARDLGRLYAELSSPRKFEQVNINLSTELTNTVLALSREEGTNPEDVLRKAIVSYQQDARTKRNPEAMQAFRESFTRNKDLYERLADV